MKPSLRSFSVFILPLFAASAWATSVPRLSLEQMVDSSERILHGRTVRSWSAWDADHRIIWTHYEIEVADTLKEIGRASCRERV